MGQKRERLKRTLYSILLVFSHFFPLSSLAHPNQPSRELAEQTLKQVQMFGKYIENPKVRDLLVVGGVPVKDQIAALSAGIDIVCGTPGRLEELINSGQLSLQACKFFVLDEADGLLKQVSSKVTD